MLAFSLFNRYALTECTEKEKEMQRLPAFRFCSWSEYFAQWVLPFYAVSFSEFFRSDLQFYNPICLCLILNRNL